ncbi:MAG: 1-acyl-sn-glycerol-3-phosphate acyltransferase [Dehalococcoidia bacterium]|nr:1-acyl-sn-glycerol-3-phosphate acyltransferase [Dehalococcoidia bacterium]MSQ17148.1 1-acyl-sn-glycerol-3-phosphate acyltransferase [Dehalococcoidia bacterium]
MPWLYRPGRALARFSFSVLGRMEVEGLEAVPPFGPLIVVANHLSNHDPPLLAACLRRRLSFLGKRELFVNPVAAWVMRSCNVYPLDRDGPGVEALRLALDLLARDAAVVIFPEGRRSPDHAMQEGLAGTAYIALRSQAAILPVGITGTEHCPTWRMPFPLCRFKVHIGQPFTLPVLEGRVSREVVNSLRDMIMQRVAAQLPPDYRGVYALPKADD